MPAAKITRYRHLQHRQSQIEAAYKVDGGYSTLFRCQWWRYTRRADENARKQSNSDTVKSGQTMGRVWQWKNARGIKAGKRGSFFIGRVYHISLPHWIYTCWTALSGQHFLLLPFQGSDTRVRTKKNNQTQKNLVVFFGYTHLKNPPQKTHTSTLT